MPGIHTSEGRQFCAGLTLQVRNLRVGERRLTPIRSNQVLTGDDFAEPTVIRNEFLDKFMQAALEHVVHMAVFEAVADAAGMALRGALPAVGNADLIEIA